MQGSDPVATDFAHTLRSLASERRSSRAVIPALLAGCAWGVWFVFSSVDVYVSAPSARVEVVRMVNHASARDQGRVSAIRTELGRVVVAGEVLAELESDEQDAELDLLRAELGSARRGIVAMGSQIDAERARRESSARLDELSKQRALLGVDRAELIAAHELELAGIARDLLGQSVASRIEALRAERDARESRIALNDAATEVERSSAEHAYQHKVELARAAELERQLAELLGQEEIVRARIAAAETALERRKVRAPVAGKLGNIAAVQVGDVLRAGDSVATIVPNDDVRVVAYLPPQLSVGQVAPGQAARVRLDGFSWVEFGMIEAEVTSTASEPRDGTIRVELAIDAHNASRIPVQHGLTGSVDICTARASPWELLQRSVGAAFLPSSAAQVVRAATLAGERAP